MRNFVPFIILIFLVCSFRILSRDITNLDIARWYLDSDLVVICSVNHIDTINISRFDTLMADKTKVSLDNVREKYQVTIDSVIRSINPEFQKTSVFMSQVFAINFCRFRELVERRFIEIDSEGDSVFGGTVLVYSDNADDSGYFRLKSGRKHLVILRKTIYGFIIDYQSECDPGILKLIREIKSKAELYFNEFQ